jgi:hypothetical protein
MNDSGVVLGKVTKSIFALWSLEVACILSDFVLAVIAIWILFKKHKKNFEKMSDSGGDDEEFLGQLIRVSRLLKWFALFSALLSSVRWLGVAFSFSIGRYFNEVCAGMDQASPTFQKMQSYIFDPTTCVPLLMITLILTRVFGCDNFLEQNTWSFVHQIPKRTKTMLCLMLLSRQSLISLLFITFLASTICLVRSIKQTNE